MQPHPPPQPPTTLTPSELLFYKFGLVIVGFLSQNLLSITITEINLGPARKEISLCVTLTTCIRVLTI